MDYKEAIEILNKLKFQPKSGEIPNQIQLLTNLALDIAMYALYVGNCEGSEKDDNN